MQRNDNIGQSVRDRLLVLNVKFAELLMLIADMFIRLMTRLIKGKK